MTNDLNPKDIVWTEKYRPTKVSEMVGDFKIKILKYLENVNKIPHFLFHSMTPGTGKTTLSKAIINELGCDSLVINSSNDRKIETIREKVKEFALTQSSKQGLRRCVFLDEFDGMLKASQEALRNLMETYASNCFFILTCNNINKVHDAIMSRCVVMEFARPDRNEIYEYCKMICENESLEYTEDGLKELIKLNYPSIRNCVVKLQDLHTEGLSVTIENAKPNTELYDNMWTLLKDGKWQEVKTIVLENTVNSRQLNKHFWLKALEESNIKMIQLSCRNEKDIAWGADEKVIFVTTLIEMAQSMRGTKNEK